MMGRQAGRYGMKKNRGQQMVFGVEVEGMRYNHEAQPRRTWK
jgi:hypothetical protein